MTSYGYNSCKDFASKAWVNTVTPRSPSTSYRSNFKLSEINGFRLIAQPLFSCLAVCVAAARAEDLADRTQPRPRFLLKPRRALIPYAAARCGPRRLTPRARGFLRHRAVTAFRPPARGCPFSIETLTIRPRRSTCNSHPGDAAIRQ